VASSSFSFPEREGAALHYKSKHHRYHIGIYISTQHFENSDIFFEFPTSQGCALQVSPFGGDLEGAKNPQR